MLYIDGLTSAVEAISLEHIVALTGEGTGIIDTVCILVATVPSFTLVNIYINNSRVIEKDIIVSVPYRCTLFHSLSTLHCRHR